MKQHYVTTLTLNHERIKKVLQRISVFKPFISKYDWEGINQKNITRKSLAGIIQQLFLC